MTTTQETAALKAITRAQLKATLARYAMLPDGFFCKLRTCAICHEPLHGDPQEVNLCDEHAN